MSARRSTRPDSSDGLDRRQFLAAGGTGLLAAGIPGASQFAEAANALPPRSSPSRSHQIATGAKKKIPIGVFDPVYDTLSLDQMLDKVTALGLEAMEIGTGGYPGANHCPIDELLADPAKAKAWVKKFEDRGLRVATLSCHGNPVHPDAKHAARDAETLPQDSTSCRAHWSKGHRRIFGLSRRRAHGHAAQLDHLPLAPRVRSDAPVAMERKGGALLERSRQIRARTRHSSPRV